jgi:uncharacterized membrane-anchored protein YhcB (DUF1043 family)
MVSLESLDSGALVLALVPLVIGSLLGFLSKLFFDSRQRKDSLKEAILEVKKELQSVKGSLSAEIVDLRDPAAASRLERINDTLDKLRDEVSKDLLTSVKLIKQRADDIAEQFRSFAERGRQQESETRIEIHAMLRGLASDQELDIIVDRLIKTLEGYRESISDLSELVYDVRESAGDIERVGSRIEDQVDDARRDSAALALPDSSAK